MGFSFAGGSRINFRSTLLEPLRLLTRLLTPEKRSITPCILAFLV